MNIDHYFEKTVKLYGIGLNVYKNTLDNSNDFEDENNITGLSEILIPFKDPKDVNNYYGKMKINNSDVYCFKTLTEDGNLSIDCNELYLDNVEVGSINFIVEVQAIDMGDNIPKDIKLIRKLYFPQETIEANKNIEINISHKIN